MKRKYRVIDLVAMLCPDGQTCEWDWEGYHTLYIYDESGKIIRTVHGDMADCDFEDCIITEEMIA